jgi:hypothetical protein
MANQFTSAELADMVLVYGQALSNTSLYIEIFSNRVIPNVRTFTNIFPTK